MAFYPKAAEKPSEIYFALGPLQPCDVLRMRMMTNHRKVEFLRTIYGRYTLEYAKHQYKLMTGITLDKNRKRKS